MRGLAFASLAALACAEPLSMTPQKVIGDCVSAKGGALAQIRSGKIAGSWREKATGAESEVASVEE